VRDERFGKTFFASKILLFESGLRQNGFAKGFILDQSVRIERIEDLQQRYGV
jgi:hypothetical protein